MIAKWSCKCTCFTFYENNFDILMYKCIHKPIFHTQTAEIPQTCTYEVVWQSSNHHTQTFAKLAKHLEKPLLQFQGNNVVNNFASNVRKTSLSRYISFLIKIIEHDFLLVCLHGRTKYAFQDFIWLKNIYIYIYIYICIYIYIYIYSTLIFSSTLLVSFCEA